MEVTVEIFKNKMVLSANETTKAIFPSANFTTERLLVGNFEAAVNCLSDGLKQIGVKSFYRFGRPILHIYPRELIEGGLSNIELRMFQDLGSCAGARKTSVHVVESA